MIEEIADGSEGRRSFLGVLHEGSGRRFVITVGPGATLAYIPTPQGTYELVAEGRYGWLMPSVNMDADVDYSTPDYFIPED